MDRTQRRCEGDEQALINPWFHTLFPDAVSVALDAQYFC